VREETLVRNLIKFQSMLEGFIASMVGGPGPVEDLFQEVAVVMTRKREEFDEEGAGAMDGPFLAWARAIAVNVVRDYWRSRKVRDRVRVLDDEAIEAVAAVYQETDGSIWETRKRALDQCVDHLPEKQRDLVRMKYEKNATIDDLAAALGRRRGAVDTMFYRIRKALRQCVETSIERSGAAP
jgi:RNA polymerase sigma-70 factor, ECF subfamily